MRTGKTMWRVATLKESSSQIYYPSKVQCIKAYHWCPLKCLYQATGIKLVQQFRTVDIKKYDVKWKFNRCFVHLLSCVHTMKIASASSCKNMHAVPEHSLSISYKLGFLFWTHMHVTWNFSRPWPWRKQIWNLLLGVAMWMIRSSCGPMVTAPSMVFLYT
jgi:hypothetical protein